MPALETTDRCQTAVLWPIAGRNEDGQPLVATPVELSPATGTGVRWTDTTSEVLDAQGNTIGIDAIVVVSQDIDVASVMWLGTLASLPDPPVNAMDVVKFDRASDMKNRSIRRTVYLKRRADSLPASA